MAHSETVTTVVITGGPAAGKSTVINRIVERFGRRVVVVPEAATTLLGSGIPAPTTETTELFQQVIIPLQQYNQDSLLALAKKQGAKVIVYDRGLLDGAAYVDNGLERILSYLDQDLSQVYEQIDKVINLQTVARYYPERFGKANNLHRMESDPQQAIDLDDRIQEVWRNHPQWELIDGELGIESVVELVLALIGRMMNREIERKWLITRPPLIQGYTSMQEIEQFYTSISGQGHIRYRRITQGSQVEYVMTTKSGAGLSRGEEEIPDISAFTYELEKQNVKGHIIRKTRYNFRDGAKELSLDVFGWPEGHATLEREFANVESADAYQLPPLWQIQGVEEVTDDSRYSNVELALHGLPQE